MIVTEPKLVLVIPIVMPNTCVVICSLSSLMPRIVFEEYVACLVVCLDLFAVVLAAIGCLDNPLIRRCFLLLQR